MSFGLLGPLEVWVDRRLLRMRRRKQRSLLALLLLHAGGVVSRDWLVEELWCENPPRAAVSSLQNLVSELRKALGREVVRTHVTGYALEVERECVDLHRFERLVGEARKSDSLDARGALNREALALWRGPPLSDFAFEPFAQVEIARLEELRIAAREELIDVELELGNHARLVGELEALVAEQPLRERLRVQLMLALYRSGRQTEALDAYQRARRTLTEELGLEPGEELQQLERAILNHDPLLRPCGSVSLAVGDAMEFRVLGPLEVTADSQLLRLGRTKQRALLAYLLLHANEVVSRDQLLDAMWGERPPDTAATALHGYVSGLRKVLGADRIETRSPGYLLHAASHEIDLTNFESLLSEARALEPGAAANRLAEALELWRGPPLADLGTVPFVPVEQLRLEELYLSAIEDRNEANLALGRHSELIPELQGLVHEHPLRERLRGQLMIALYRSGRQAEALEVYQHGRHSLAEELGLEPGEALKRLELAILEHDPDIQGTAIAATPAEVAAPPKPLTRGGRERVRRVFDRPLIAAALGVIILAAAAAVTGVVLTQRSDEAVTVLPNSVAVFDAETNHLVGDIVVGKRPVAIAHGEGSVWVANADDGTVSRIDPKTRKVVGAVRVGDDVRDLATGFGSVWTADGNEGTVTRIGRALNKVRSIHLPSEGEALPPPVRWIATGAGAVWATRGTTLFEINPPTNAVVARTRIPPPTGLAAGLGSGWVVTDDQRLLEVVPGTKARNKWRVRQEIGDEAFAPAVGAGSVWLLVDKGIGEIWRIDPRSAPVKPTPTAGRYPLDLAVAERDDAVWVVDITGRVLRINPNIGLAVRAAQMRRAPTLRSALAVGSGAIWVAVQD